MTLSKPPFWASAFTLAGLVILCSLGTWQARKYIAKTTNANSEVCQQNSTLKLEENFDDIGEIRGQLCRDRITLKGEYRKAGPNIKVGPRSHNGKVGSHLYFRLIGKDGSSILVNGGWIESNVVFFGNSILGLMTTEVTGVLVKPTGRNRFSPDNNPEKGEWFYIDTNEVAKYRNIKNLSPYVLFKQEPSGASDNFIPAELSKTYLTPQVHLQYAAFWYFMALALVGVFSFRFVIKRD